MYSRNDDCWDTTLFLNKINKNYVVPSFLYRGCVYKHRSSHEQTRIRESGRENTGESNHKFRLMFGVNENNLAKALAA